MIRQCADNMHEHKQCFEYAQNHATFSIKNYIKKQFLSILKNIFNIIKIHSFE